MKYAAISDRGMLRAKNEDSCNIVLAADVSPQAFIVADGMGGHEAGDVASAMAVQIVSDEVAVLIQNPDNDSSVKELLEDAILKANARIYQYSLRKLSGLGTGTTLTAGVLHKGKLTVAHIGDSRFYLLRSGQLQKLTRDHSFVGELVDKGILDAEEAKTHPLRNQITRALGYEAQIEIDFFEIDIYRDDIWLFCTDGLTQKVTSDELLSMLANADDPENILRNMVALANQRGGEDNITAIVVQV
ncbi:MAG: Stp1/IreP family PP2C-type Ser/Thr phosphatase [Ruminiclostridium sp.]|nr:Stp1/IreP family PP2C-type Ser/Thr phosphatase [Ruminiclostridium sp.]